MMLANWYISILSCRCHYCNVVNWIIINPVIKNGCWFCNETRIRANSGRIIHYKTWPSIDTYLFFKFEVRKNFGLSQLDKDGIEISCAPYFCLLNVNWLQLFLTSSHVYWRIPLDWICSKMRKYQDTMQKRYENCHNLTN